MVEQLVAASPTEVGASAELGHGVRESPKKWEAALAHTALWGRS